MALKFRCSVDSCEFFDFGGFFESEFSRRLRNNPVLYDAPHERFLENWDTFLGFFRKQAWNLIFSVAFGYGCTAVGELELHGDGLQWHTVGYVTTPTRLVFKTVFVPWIDSLLYMC